MNKTLQQQRMNLELNQIRSILNDFRKTKSKCIQLANSIGAQMPKQDYFISVEKNTLRKMDLLDLAGLVGLKNQLVRALTDLFEIERELRYKKQKNDAKRQAMLQDFEQPIDSPYTQIDQPRNQYILHGSIRTQTTRQNKIISQTIGQVEQRSKPKNLQIPLYRPKNETNQHKLDRISKYVASLKRNIKLNSQTLGYKWKIKEFLMEDPNYLKLRNELERYMMREEELEKILASAIEKKIRDFIQKSEIVESTSEYKLIKIYKQKNIKQYKKTRSLLTPQSENTIKQQAIQSNDSLTQSLNLITNNQFSCEFQPLELLRSSPKSKIKNKSSVTQFSDMNLDSPLRKLSTKIQIQTKAEEDFNLIKRQLQKSNQSYIEMLSKINQTVEERSEKIIQLREKRKKKVEKDDQAWDQLDKI